MPSITPISTSRVSNLLIQQRLMTQLQDNQTSLLHLQTALSTGKAFDLPSENAAAAQRALSLQGLLQQKDQIKINLQTNQSYLGATDSAASGVAQLLAQARGIALQGADSGAGASGRAAAALQIDQIIQQIVSIGNQQFRGRYLFAGAATDTLPYEITDNVVRYNGDDQHLQSYSDIGVLFDTNVTGSEIFGGLSPGVQGTADLDPRVTANTRLSELNGGQGVGAGSIVISDGATSKIVDISQAETLGDVASLIERNAPAGRELRTTITGQGLNVELLPTVPPTAGNLTIKEVGVGTTAHELGIFNSTGVGVGTIVGQDLNPRLTTTTLLDNILGVRASARVFFTGSNNDVSIEANQRGAALNDVTITFVDGGPSAAGNEIAVYNGSNPLAKTLTVTIADGVSTAQSVVDAINATNVFHASLDTADSGNDGTGKIQATTSNPLATATTAGGSGIEPDYASGIQVSNNGQTFAIDLSNAKSIEDVLNAFNHSGASVLAQINAAGTGIDIRSRLSGADFSVGENGGQTATQLGLRTLTASTRLDSLNHGDGVGIATGGSFQIRRKDSAIINVDLTGLQTVGDVISAINTSASNPNDAWHVTARLATNGNGIELAASSAPGVAALAVLSTGGSTAYSLGLLPSGQTVSPPAVVNGAEETITGRDVAPQGSQGALDALIRLRNALKSNDQSGIASATNLLDQGTTQLNFAQSTLGVHEQTVSALLTRLDSEQTDLKGAFSQETDADIAQVISDFLARQAAFQASLQMIGQTSKLTLLDFI